VRGVNEIYGDPLRTDQVAEYVGPPMALLPSVTRALRSSTTNAVDTYLHQELRFKDDDVRVLPSAPVSICLCDPCLSKRLALLKVW
jgi:hypothetical protein